MSKEDLGDAPEQVPKKRRALEQAPDLWVAQWLARDSLTPSERRRVQEVKDSRKRPAVRVIVGFTGTRSGMTPQQKSLVREALRGADEAHHGDCIGADEQFHELARREGVDVVIHPPSDAKQRAWCQGAIRVEQAKPYLDRNKDIVQASTVLVGTPKELYEPQPGRGQGTWSTIRYARNRSVRRRVFMPDGKELE